MEVPSLYQLWRCVRLKRAGALSIIVSSCKVISVRDCVATWEKRRNCFALVAGLYGVVAARITLIVLGESVEIRQVSIQGVF